MISKLPLNLNKWSCTLTCTSFTKCVKHQENTYVLLPNSIKKMFSDMKTNFWNWSCPLKV